MTSLCLIFSVHVREPGEEASRVQMDRRIHSVERDDRGKIFMQLCNITWLNMHWFIISRHIYLLRNNWKIDIIFKLRDMIIFITISNIRCNYTMSKHLSTQVQYQGFCLKLIVLYALVSTTKTDINIEILISRLAPNQGSI